MDKIDLAFFGYIGTATLLTAITIVLVTNRDSWMPIARQVMSRLLAAVPERRPRASERRSHAAGQHGNGVERSQGTAFRSVIMYLEQCDDDLLLDILAQLTTVDGDYRFAESRVAKFIPGRVEDRLSAVRAVRDTAPPPPSVRLLRVRDADGERMIPIDA